MQKLITKALGIAIITFALLHLILNLYISILPCIVKSDELKNVMKTLSDTFGQIAVREDRDPAILCVKISVSALFFCAGIGITELKEWSRKLLFCLLEARIVYGLIICVTLSVLHLHMIAILMESLILFCYFNLPNVRKQFG
jgi:hypothetical protein